jgi:predicted PolB exonuclease-like 3'-5' exonuclease
MRGVDFVIFDIETVPDPALATEDELVDAKTGKARFPAPPMHKVVAIAVTEFRRAADGSMAFLGARAGGAPGASEQELIAGFWKAMGKTEPTLVGFNSRGFDLPVLLHRSLRHGLEAPLYFQGDSKWECYRQRYAVDWHLDLCEALSEFGASRKISLDLAARLVGAPGKLDVDGGDVEAMVEAGLIEDVRAYCVTDTLSTGLVWLAWLRVQGRISAAQREAVETEIAAWLAERRAAEPHLGRFLDAWRGGGGVP